MTSENTASAASRFRLSVDRLTLDASQVLPVDSVAPSAATWSAMASALRDFVPSSSMCAVRSASPARSGGLAAPPVLIMRFKSTSGRS